jgi:4-hydroxy-3-methylbut-2-enyl diphosphate reductase IspH
VEQLLDRRGGPIYVRKQIVHNTHVVADLQARGDETTEIVAALRARFPALCGPASDDICYATTNRQDALTAIAEESDLVLVIGSTNSSNSVRLVELAHRHGTPSYLINDAGDIRPTQYPASQP